MDSRFIPEEEISRAISCPICFELPQACVITPCGHSFCKKCIKECINLKHECPVCKKELTSDDNLLENRAIHNLVENAEKSMQHADLRYTRLLMGCAAGGIPMDDTGAPTLSPIEDLFVNHLREALSGYQTYFERLKASYEQHIPSEEQSANSQTENAARFQESVNMLLADYEACLKGLPKSPFLVPSHVNIVVPSKNLRFDMQLLPTHYPSKIFDMIRRQFQSLGDQVLQFEEDCSLHLRQSGNLPCNVRLRHGEGAQPVFMQVPQGRVDTGSIIQLEGGIKLKSEQKKPCFAKVFDASTLRSLTYFSCQTCSMNWICDSCSKSCHRDHVVTVHIENHTPTWACCYCARKKDQCQLQDAIVEDVL